MTDNPLGDGDSHAEDESIGPLRASDDTVSSPPQDGARQIKPDPPPSVSIEGYRVTRILSAGGQGVVYQAIQEATGQKVAIKVLLESLDASQAARKRFDREIKVVAQLDHPDIISILDSSETAEGLPCFIMKYARGEALTRYVRERKVTLEQALKLFVRVCEAVQHAHLKGVVHRDLKPSNILVDANAHPKVLDFGLAKPLAGQLDAAISISRDVVGTLAYMSPEQTRGKLDEVDARSDVYSLGVVLYEALTGYLPYDPLIGNVGQTIKRIVETPPIPPSRRWTSHMGVAGGSSSGRGKSACPIDAEIETILLKALAKDRQRRYQSADELARDLQRYLGGEPIQARRDSIGYLLHTKARRAIGAHPVVAWVGAVVIAVLAAQNLGVPLLFDWTPVNAWFVKSMTTAFPVGGDESALRHVRMIALTDATDVAALARREGLAGVSVSARKSLRRLHGRLMERLAGCGCKVIVWDVKFWGSTPFDEDFARGVQALRRSEINVVVPVDTAWLDDSGTPAVSERIGQSTRLGHIVALLDSPAWYLALAITRPPGSAKPSLVLAALAAHRHPETNVDITLSLEPADESITLVYWQPHPSLPGTPIRVGEPDVVGVTGVRLAPHEAEDVGLLPDDLVGYYQLWMPPDDVLHASTVDYQRVMTADGAQLREWFAAKAVVVGDFRSGIDRHLYSDGRELGGFHAHAVGLDYLLREVAIRQPRAIVEFAIIGAGVLLGALLAPLAAHRHLRRLGAWCVAGLLLVGASIGAYWQLQYLVNPAVPVFALVISGELAAVVIRSHHSRRLYA